MRDVMSVKVNHRRPGASVRGAVGRIAHRAKCGGRRRIRCEWVSGRHAMPQHRTATRTTSTRETSTPTTTTTTNDSADSPSPYGAVETRAGQQAPLTGGRLWVCPGIPPGVPELVPRPLSVSNSLTDSPYGGLPAAAATRKDPGCAQAEQGQGARLGNQGEAERLPIGR